MSKLKNFIYGFLFIIIFFFVGSGMLEAIIIKILEVFGK